MGQLRLYRNKNEKYTNHKISTMEEFTKSRKEHRRHNSSKKRVHSNQNKRPTSPKAVTFYGKMTGVDKPKFITKNAHQKVFSATNGFDFYDKTEKIYTNSRPGSKTDKCVITILNLLFAYCLYFRYYSY